MTTEPLTIGIVAGAVAPFIAALIHQPTIPPVWRRLIPIGLAVALAALGMALVYWPASGQAVAAVIMTAVGTMQVVFTAFKKAGIDGLENATTLGKDTHGGDM